MRLTFGSTGLLLVLLIILGFSPLVVAGTGAKTIGTDELHAMVVGNAYKMEAGQARQFVIIDARIRQKYDEGHILSAISVPESGFERSTELLPKDKSVLLAVYCNSKEHGTCIKWADKAAAVGYTNIVIYSEGFAVWKESYKPIVPIRRAQ